MNSIMQKCEVCHGVGEVYYDFNKMKYMPAKGEQENKCYCPECCGRGFTYSYPQNIGGGGSTFVSKTLNREDILEELKSMDGVEEWEFDKSQYCIMCNGYGSEPFKAWEFCYAKDMSGIYFESKESCENAIKKLGREKLYLLFGLDDIE